MLVFLTLTAKLILLIWQMGETKLWCLRPWRTGVMSWSGPKGMWNTKQWPPMKATESLKSKLALVYSELWTHENQWYLWCWGLYSFLGLFLGSVFHFYLWNSLVCNLRRWSCTTPGSSRVDFHITFRLLRTLVKSSFECIQEWRIENMCVWDLHFCHTH